MSSLKFQFSPHVSEILSALPGVRAQLDTEESTWVELWNRRDIELEDYLANLTDTFRIWDTGNSAGGEGSMSEEVTTTGAYNTAVGAYSMADLTEGTFNTAEGAFSLQHITTGSLNTAVGAAALSNNDTGASNVAVGFAALTNNTSGSTNVAVGVNTLKLNTTGNENAALGHQAAQDNTTGDFNTALGDYALKSGTTGDYNTAAGDYALAGPRGDVANGTTTGGSNTAVGARTGQLTSTQRDRSSALGFEAVFDGSNALALGASTAAGADGSVALGTDNTGAGASTATVNEIVLGTPLHTVRIPGALDATGQMDALFLMDSPHRGERGAPGATGAVGAAGAAADESLIWMQSAVPGPVGPAGPAGAGGSGDETLLWMNPAPAPASGPVWPPTYVPPSTCFTVPADTQVLFSLPIVVDGSLDILGALVEVS